MAINSHDIQSDKTSFKPQTMADKHRKFPGHGRLLKIDYTAESKKFKNSLDLSSPYLNGGSLNILSTVTEKCVQKKGIMSSFPLAATLYKASSHEFKVAKNKKKVKKSVLTLPSTNALLPQSCTVSDMNDAEYNKRNGLKKPKKRNTPAYRKSRRRGNEYYDRDAQYLTQLNIDLDCSSTDMTKTGKNIRGKSKMANQPHDVWTVLRNINTFQFNQSPPASDYSLVSPKMKTTKRRNAYNHNNRNDMRLVETCCTEEFAYISSYDVDSKSPYSFSASSFDKVTVIDKQENFNTLFKHIGDRMVKTKELVKAGKKKGKQTKNKGKNNKNSMVCLPGESNIYGDQPDSFYGDTSLYQNNMFQIENDCRKDQSQDSLILDDRTVDTHNDSQSIDVIYSSYSGSSKGFLCHDTPLRTTQIRKTSPKGREVAGITKVVFSKVLNTVQPSKPELKLNNRETAFTPKGPRIVPKLNQTNIQRKLHKLTFPIVILGKDQLTDKPFEIIKEDPPQFNGLEEQIWPYMIEWPEKDCSKTSRQSPRSPQATYKKEVTNHEVERVLQKMKVSSGKQVKAKDPSVSKFSNRNKYEPKTSIVDEKKESPIYKPLQQIRSRMFRLLNKDMPQTAIASSKTDNATKRRNVDALDNVPSCRTREDNNETISSRNTNLQLRQKKPLISSEKRPWSQTKWVSDVIDNVMRKIRCGAYYTNAGSVTKISTECVLDEDSRVFDLKSETTEDNVVQSISKVTITKKCESVSPIPGFDNSLPPLQIETMSSNEIAVKHCTANIILRFDVTVPTDCEMQLNKPFMPLEVSENKAKVFKCRTSIINAMLPAELCSLLPKMMKNLMESREMLDSSLLQPVDKSDRLSTIPESLRLDNLLMYRITTVPPKIGRLLIGWYWKPGKLPPICEKKTFKIRYDSQLIKEMMTSPRRQLLDYVIDCTIKSIPVTIPTTPKEIVSNTCTALIPYVPPDFRLADFSVPRLDNKISFDSVILNTVNVIFNSNASITLTISEPCVNIFGISSVIAMTIPYRNDINGFKELSFNTYKPVIAPAIEYIIEEKSQRKRHSVIKPKKSKVSRAKCKFAPKSTKEKWTSLSKIKNINDFFKALGASRTLSGVFDNISSRKIMSCILQMKNWTKQISPKQALLVLLLTSKRETPSLLSYRPMLLQGISVHRITKAHELDMEIEVIEREHLKKIPQCEGITYLPASPENQDELFEELYWIAKTTASDYQRPFDESQEKLLRSLLEKRKKLNAPYLRVMARYVGLGLLKSPGKK